MSDNYMSLVDLTVINDSNTADIEVSDLFQRAPLLAALSAVPASNGTMHKYFKTITAPVVGFRDFNDGREHDVTGREGVTVDLKVFDASFTVDTAIARSYRGGAEELVRMEAMEHLRQAFFKLESQIFNGVAEGDSDGFEGLADEFATLDECVGAGGTTALTSVYLIRSGVQDVSVVAGNDGQLTIGETNIQRVAGATGWYMAYITEIMALYGLQIGSSTKSAVRIANVDASSNGVTDELLYDGLELFESAMPPSFICMNRRSAGQLRKSRTATNATGAPAPWPTEIEGIPIIVCDSIGNTETAVEEPAP